MAAGKLSRESKFILVPLEKRYPGEGSEIRRKCMVVKIRGRCQKLFFLRLTPYKQARRELAGSQRETPNDTRTAC